MTVDLYHVDALQQLAAMPEGIADMLCTDPPYPLTSGGQPETKGHRLMSGCFKRGNYDNGGAFFGTMPKWAEFMPLLYRSLKDGGHAYIMCNDKNLLDMLRTAESAGFRFHNMLTWRKGTVTPNRWYMKSKEFTGFFYKGRARAINDCGSACDVYVPQTDVTQHPTEKPPLLMQMYIRNSTQPGQTVLDPFMGTGTTGVAAKGIGRNFIGMENDRQWYDIAQSRIDAAQTTDNRLLL